MNLPIQFPNEADVIAEETARFRSLSTVDRIESIRDLIDAGAFMMQIAAKPAFQKEYSEQQRAEQTRPFGNSSPVMPETNRLAEDLIRAVELLEKVFAARSTNYTLVGDLATTLRGRPRFTKDVDVLIDVPQVALPGLLDELLARGFTLEPMTVIREYVRDHLSAFQYRGVRID